MSKTETVRIRIEPDMKLAAEAIFSALGLSASDAVTLFYKQVELNRGLPFEVKLPPIPNATTRKALENAKRGKGMKSYRSLDALKEKFE